MGKYLKLFNNKNDYNEFIDSSDYVLPNVSYIMELGDVKFNPDTEPAEPEVPSDICVTMKFEATEDNLLAFEYADCNLIGITVDEQPIDVTPIDSQDVVMYVTSIDAALSYENIIPENTMEFCIETIDTNDKFTDNTILSIYVPDLHMGVEYTLSQCTELGLVAYDKHKIILIFQPGTLDGYTFNAYTSDGNLIKTKQTCMIFNQEDVQTLTFGSPGLHTVKLFLKDSKLRPLYGFSNSNLIECKFENITDIGLGVFASCRTLKNIDLGNKLKTIGAGAFYGCYSLSAIEIPETVTNIDAESFKNCSGLTSVTIGEGVTFIGEEAFYGCSNLPVIDGIRYADTYLIETVDESLTEYTIKEGTKWISQRAFYNNYNIVSVTIPNTVTSINDEAFYYCYKLSSVEIPDSVQTIGNDAFYYCSGLTSVTFGNGLKSIGDAAFCGCKQITSIIIPDSVETIGESAFLSCNSLTDVTIGSGVVTIGYSAFDSLNLPVINGIRYADTYLVGVIDKTMAEYTIKEGTKWFNSHAFDGCESLTGITIPKSVIGIGEYSFGNCPSLEYMDVDAENTAYDSRDNSNCIIETKTNKLVFGCKNTVIPNTVNSIGSGAFMKCDSLKTIIIPDSVTSIDYFAFTGCTNLQSISLGNSVAKISMYAFSTCSSLTSLNIPDATRLIESYAFAGCSNLVSLSIGFGTRMISADAFKGCGHLESIVVSTANTAYDSRENCNCLIRTDTDTIIRGSNNSFVPHSISTISGYAFNYCSKMTSITLGSGLTAIDRYAFESCSNLTSIISWATSAPSIKSYSFYGVAKNGILYIPYGATGYNTWMSTGGYYLGYYGWTNEMAYTPLECISLTITADTVGGRQTTTTIYYTAVTNGVDINGAPLNNISITGATISEEFPQNTSETETVERTITFEYMGATASTIITQGIWEAAAYTVNLNNQWQLSTSISNPDSNTYEGVYESYSNKGVDYSAAIMYIDIVGFENFEFYIRSYAESSYDYVVVSQLDQTLNSGTSYSNTTLVKAHTRDKQNGGTAIGNYQLVEFTNIDGGEHRISVMYRKDSSASSNNDQGYVLIPKNQ